MLRAVVVVIVSAFGLASCNRRPEAAQHTVAEYRANPDLRRDQMARCADDPGTLGSTPDCVNAREAARLDGIGSVRGLPPVGLPPPSKK